MSLIIKSLRSWKSELGSAYLGPSSEALSSLRPQGGLVTISCGLCAGSQDPQEPLEKSIIPSTPAAAASL